jgi:hypothetical protein
MKAMATERIPSAWAHSSADRMAASSSGAISTRCVEASGDFGNLFVEQFRQPDRQVEEARTRLRADPQEIAEAFGHQEEDRAPLRSSSALVATVVPILTLSIGASWPRLRRAIPSTAASA